MSQQKSSSRRYQIDLDRSRAPRAYRDEQSLWRNDIERIYDLIDRQIGELKEWEERQERQGLRQDSEVGENYDDRPHLSIAIFGPSGSGKSSLIRTLADDVGRKHGSVLPDKLGSKIVTLPVMDPTTWAATDQFLYAFLAAALEEERKAQQKKEHGFPQGLSPVQLAFQEVNEYLRVVDEPESSEEHDPLGLSLQKLERHTSGLRLRQALGDLVEELAREFRAEIVLLPVDDLDMAPGHLVDSLQSYQSFLTHPRLVPVFAFTDRMPEELIEVYYKRQMAEAASHERLGGTNRLSISEQMSVQFLARCFPVRNRIRLGPAPARLQRALFSSRTAVGEFRSKQEKTQVFELLTQASFLLFGYPDGEDAHRIRAALRPSTLRRQFQVIDAISDCQLGALRTPQLAAMAGLKTFEIEQISSIGEEKRHSFWFWKWQEKSEDNSAGWVRESKRWGNWLESDKERRSLGRTWPTPGMKLIAEAYEEGYLVLAHRLKELNVGATWGTIFNKASWSLLNVHRDTLRELGLFLEDLYSWTPKELRSVVLENILAQDQVTRRTVVDRWFNRTDYRRSQILSLLAANVFRPWMPGEEPYGDEELPIWQQIELEKRALRRSGHQHPLDRDFEQQSDAFGDSKEKLVVEQGQLKGEDLDESEIQHQIRKRLTIHAPTGLLWFFNVTLGFYLPQIMARNWGEAMRHDLPVKSRMGGNGWDLHHAATNAARLADARQEMFSFGMLFLDPTAYRKALEVPGAWPRKPEAPRRQSEGSTDPDPSPEKIEVSEKPLDYEALRVAIKSRGSDARSHRQMWRRHLLLRIWTCCGYSTGRYWAVFSLWRGLSFIGQVIELGLRHSAVLGRQIRKESKIAEDYGPSRAKRQKSDAVEEYLKLWKKTKKEKYREIEAARTRGGEVGDVGTARMEAEKNLKKHADDHMAGLQADLFRLVRSHGLQGLVPGSLLNRNSNDERLLHGYPKWDPRGDEIESEIQRLGRDLIAWLIECWDDLIYPLPAGDLWIGWKDCFIRRIHGEYVLGGLWPRLNSAYIEEHGRVEGWAELGIARKDRHKPGVELPKELDSESESEKYRWAASLAAGAWSDILFEYWRGCPPVLKLLLTCPVLFRSQERFGFVKRDGLELEPERSRKVHGWVFRDLREGKSKEERQGDSSLKSPDEKRAYSIRRDWLDRLGLPPAVWKEVQEFWTEDVDGSGWNLVSSEFAIPRVQAEQFTAPDEAHHAIRFEDAVARTHAGSKKEPDKTVYLTSDKDKLGSNKP